MNDTQTIQQLSFFNTIHLTGEALAEMIKQCNRQEGRVLEIMKDGRQFSPFDVLREYETKYPPTPVTSIRRAITVLTRKGFLTKCDKMKNECLGKPNHTWTISRGSFI